MILGAADVTAELAAALPGHTVVRLVPGRDTADTGDGTMHVDVASRESLAACHRRLGGPNGRRVGAVVNLMGLSPPDAGADAAPLPAALGWLHAIQEFADDLKASAREGGGWIVNVTALDGRLGAAGPEDLGQAATLGITKVAAREIPGARVRCVDVAPDITGHRRAALVAAELTAADELTEVGHDRAGRWTLETVPTDAPADSGPLPIDNDSVVLVTGGATGVTAAAALELARQARPRLVIVGRSPLPGPEPESTRRLDRAGLRAHVLEAAQREGRTMKPAEVEARVKRILKDREMVEMIAALRATGAAVEYHAVDARDGDAFAAVVRRVYADHGRIDGVIHGAGVVEDKLLRDKTDDSFARVFATKVEPALTLVRELRLESLRFLVFFSSVSARLGARGQVDYAAANEALNKLAAHLAARTPARVVAVNWGPWRGGMVSDELLRQYAARRIEAIDVAVGARRLVDELRIPPPAAAEVVIVAGSFADLTRGAEATTAGPPAPKPAAAVEVGA